MESSIQDCSTRTQQQQHAELALHVHAEKKDRCASVMNNLNRAYSTSTVKSGQLGAAGSNMESVILGGGIPFDQMSLTSITSSVFSSVRSHSTHIESEGFVPRSKICLIGDSVSPTLEAAAESFDLPVLRSPSGHEFLDDASVVLVVDDFQSDVFEKLLDIKWRVFGSAALVQLANELQPLPVVKRPLFSFTMRGVVTCFTGIRERNLMMELMFLIRSMGGSVRKEPNRETTHLIAATTNGPKYEYASTFLVPIMSAEWVWACWRQSDNLEAQATDEDLMVHRLKPFVDVMAAFIGFPKDEIDEVEVLLRSNGGELVDVTDPLCTHIVADDDSPVTIPVGACPTAALVTAAWFWSSIQQVLRAREAEFLVPAERLRRPPKRGSVRRQASGPRMVSNKENVDPASPACASPCASPYRLAAAPTPLQTRNGRRLSLANIESPAGNEKTLTPCSPSCCSPPLHALAAAQRATPSTPSSRPSPRRPGLPASGFGSPLTTCAPGVPCSPARRGPGATPAAARATPPPPPRTPARRSLSSSDCTRTPASPGGRRTPRRQSIALGRKGSLAGVAASPVSPRFGAFLELMHTEENYVGILDAILQMRSDALNCSQAGGVLLTQTEAKMIFGTLMPIAATHHAILKDLRLIYNNWRETANVGEVYQKYSPALLRDYAPFVQSFEDAKDTLQQVSERNPRFHAFLKVCKGRPECGRQELHELMIRPVQRLGSCVLLLRELLKHTPEDSPDRKQLQSALESLSHVLSLINEDKRKMDSLCKVFDVFNLIEKCPAQLVSSHRSLVVECEGVEVTEHGFGKQGKTIAFFVFTDTILVCKKKSKVVAMTKGQAGSNIPPRVLKVVYGKPYKFLQMLPLSTVKKIVDVANSETVSNTVGVVFRGKTEMRESCSYFRLTDAGDALDGRGAALDKAHLIERWSGALAAHNCVADPAKFVQRETADEAGILTAGELLSKQINKAALMAVKTQVIVTSAFLGRTASNASKSSAGSASSPPCIMSSFNSTSKLETMQERLLEDDDEPVERPKPSSLNKTS